MSIKCLKAKIAHVSSDTAAATTMMSTYYTFGKAVSTKCMKITYKDT